MRISNCSLLLIYLPRKDERVSRLGWLTYSGRFTHMSGHPSAAGRLQDSESSPVRDRRSTTVPRNQEQEQRREDSNADNNGRERGSHVAVGVNRTLDKATFITRQSGATTAPSDGTTKQPRHGPQWPSCQLPWLRHWSEMTSVTSTKASRGVNDP